MSTNPTLRSAGSIGSADGAESATVGARIRGLLPWRMRAVTAMMNRYANR